MGDCVIGKPHEQLKDREMFRLAFIEWDWQTSWANIGLRKKWPTHINIWWLALDRMKWLKKTEKGFSNCVLSPLKKKVKTAIPYFIPMIVTRCSDRTSFYLQVSSPDTSASSYSSQAGEEAEPGLFSTNTFSLAKPYTPPPTPHFFLTPRHW
jgi:hypothetical protein